MAQQIRYTIDEMYELVKMHFRDALSHSDPEKWDWSLPVYLIEGVEGWNVGRLERLVDRYHNGSPQCR